MKARLGANMRELFRLCFLILLAGALSGVDCAPADAQSPIKSPLLWTYYNENSSEETQLIALSGDAEYLAMSTRSPSGARIHLLDLQTKSSLWNFSSTGYITSLAICGDGEYIASAFSWGDKSLRLFSSATNISVWEYAVESGMETVTISGDGNYIAAAEMHGVLGETVQVYLFERLNSSPVWSFAVGGGSGHPPALSFDGALLAVTSPPYESKGATLNLLAKTSNVPQWSFDIGYGSFGSPSISDDGSYIAIGSFRTDPGGSFYANELYLFHRASNVPLWIYTPETGIGQVAISGDGNSIVAATAINYAGDGKAALLLFDKGSSSPLWVYKVSGSISSVAVSNNGNFLAALIDGRLYYFKREGAEPVWAYGNGYKQACISDDGRYIVVSQNSGFSVFDTSIEIPADVWVDDDYCSTCANGGHQWGYDAFAKIQEAVEALWAGGTVHVASGTYYEVATNRGGTYEDVAVYIAGDNIKLLGEGRDTTVIDSDRNANRVLLTGKGCEIKGFTIRNSGPYHCGVYLHAAGENKITESRMVNNGTGIKLEWSGDCLIENNTISHNSFGISNQDSPRNTFSRNAVSYNGLGITSHSHGTVITNSIIWQNGTGIRTEYSSGGIFHSNTITGNGSGIYMYASSSSLTNCIVWGNEYELYASEGVYPVTYSNIQGGWPGENNVDADPAFVDPEKGNFHLKDYSPCIGSGVKGGAPVTDIEGNPRPNPPESDFDMGAHESPLGIRATPPLDIFGMNVGNEWVYEGTREGNPYTVERKVTMDTSTFPISTYAHEIKENGIFSEKEYYQKSADQVLLWGASIKDEGSLYDLRFSNGLPVIRFPVVVGDHQYSTTTGEFTQFPGYTFNVSMDVLVMTQETVDLGFDTFEAFKVRYEMRVWDQDLDYTDMFYWWVVPYIGAIKDEDGDSMVRLRSFAIGNGTINNQTDADRDGLKDYQELVKYKTAWLDADTDDDGCLDGPELQGGRNPLIADPEGDVNGDCALNIADAISALRVITGMDELGTSTKKADVDGDGKLGTEELIWILQRISGSR